MQGLTAMRHKVKPGHQENKVDQEKPMSLQGNLALGYESPRQTALLGTDCLSCTERLGLRQAQSE